MRRGFTFLAIAAASVALSGCAGFTVPGVTAGASSANQALSAFLTDPACSHHDEANFVTGAAGMPASFQAKVERDCPAHPAPAAAPTVAAPAPTVPAVASVPPTQ